MSNPLPIAILLDEVRLAVADFLAEGVSRHIPLPTLDPHAQALLDETLGKGEVSGEAEYGAVEIREAKFPGLWRVRRFDGGRLVGDGIEIGAIPAVVSASARRASLPEPPVLEPPFGVMNAPPVVHEIRDRLRNFRPGDPPYGINLTQMPLSPQDVTFIDRTLGAGAVALLSQGGFDCCISSTGVAHVWRVRYFNDGDSLVLDTVEIAEVPETALAAREDMENTAAELAEALRWLEG